MLKLLGIAMLAVPLAASGQTCEEGQKAQITIGARQIHCQGGTCRAYGAVAVSSNMVLRQGLVIRRGETGKFRWEFSVEPILWRIDSLGPGAHKLQNGDVLVAVNGFTVTSERGSEELSGLQADVPIRLLLRRDNRTFEVDITPAWTCDGVMVSAGPSHIPPMVAIGLENLRTAIQVRETVQAQESLRARQTLRLAERYDALRSRGAAGTLGLGIQCVRCSFRYPSGDSSAVWEFSEYPRLMSVEPGGAADEAGLQVGDVLTHVEGLDLTTPEGGQRWGTLKAGDEVEIRYRRGNESRTTTLTVDPAMR
jgi:hypothetical protein